MLHKRQQGNITVGSDPRLNGKAAFRQARIQNSPILHALMQETERKLRKVGPTERIGDVNAADGTH